MATPMSVTPAAREPRSASDAEVTAPLPRSGAPLAYTCFAGSDVKCQLEQIFLCTMVRMMVVAEGQGEVAGTARLNASLASRADLVHKLGRRLAAAVDARVHVRVAEVEQPERLPQPGHSDGGGFVRGVAVQRRHRRARAIVKKYVIILVPPGPEWPGHACIRGSGEFRRL